jgi:hypothetical protein
MNQLSILALAMICLSACAPEPGGKPVPKASDDALLQRAYESCVVDNTKEHRAQNPDLPSSLESSTMERIYHACEVAVVQTCARNKETDACKAVLSMYVRFY